MMSTVGLALWFLAALPQAQGQESTATQLLLSPRAFSNAGDSDPRLAIGEELTFVVTVTAPLGPPKEGRLMWYSNLEGFLGEVTLDDDGEGQVEVSFYSPGTRVLAVVAVDGEGRYGKLALSVDVEAAPVPLAVIVSPLDRSYHTAGVPITFEADIVAEGNVSVDGVWSHALSGPLWTDESGDPTMRDLDGEISGTASLDAGRHLLVLRLWDPETGAVSTWLQEVTVD